jgi:2-C-methyl-D-erythritol 2,4-cyclodiphosphate synthase
VLLHAITDALLGAMALGDIGELFPDTAPEHQGRDSASMLGEVIRRVSDQGYAVTNLDCIVFAESPKLSPFKAAIRENIARLVGLPVDRIGLKAKTAEGTGPVGRRDVIMAECVVLLSRQDG